MNKLPKIVLNRLNEEYEAGNIIVQSHPTLPLNIYNYSPQCQYSGNWNAATCMTRGLILDSNFNSIVARPYEKFFNLCELEKPIHEYTSYPNAFVVDEKVDGSLIIVCRYKGGVIVASRGSFTSWHAKTAEAMLPKFFPVEKIEENKTYLFELIHPENRVVLDYKGRECLVLLGIIDNFSGIDIREAELAQSLTSSEREMVILPRRFEELENGSLSSLIKFMEEKNLESELEEGYVLTFLDGFKVKVKYQQYVLLHKYFTGLSITHIFKYMHGIQSSKFINFYEGLPEMNHQGLDNLVQEFIQCSEPEMVPDELFETIRNYFNEVLVMFTEILGELRYIYQEHILNKLEEYENRNSKEFFKRASSIITKNWNEYRSGLFSIMRHSEYGVFNFIMKKIEEKLKKV